MAAKSTGSKYHLWNLFGWLNSTPDNLTKGEREQGFAVGGSGSRQPDASTRSRYHDEVTPNSGTLEHLAELEEMAESDIINPIVELYAEETTQPDVSSKRTVWFECADGGIEEELNSLLDRVGIENIIYPLAYDVCSTGNAYLRILRSRETGIERLVSVGVTGVERIYDETTRRLLGFDWKGQQPDGDQIVTVGTREIFAPWEFIHFRRLKDSTSEYGVSVLNSVWPLYKQIKLATDHMVQYRMQMMPTRHAFMIDVNDQSLLESAETVNMMKMLMRNSMLMDSRNGYMDSRFAPPGMDSMLYFPVRRDDQSKIETLQGTTDIPDVYDLDLLYKKLFGAARVPKAYIGFEENTGIAQASLVSQDIRFARMVRVLRKPLIEGIMKIGQLHLAFKGLNPEAYKIEVHMSRISALEEELNAATLERQADMANTLVGLCQTLEIPNREIIDLVFREYLHVPRHFVDLAKLAAAVEQAVGGGEPAEGGPGMGGMGGGGGGFSGGLGGDDFTAGAPGDDLAGLEDDLGLGTEEEIPQERKRNRRKGIPLTEREIKSVRGALGRIRATRKILSEATEEGKTRLTEVTSRIADLRKKVKQVESMQSIGKSSLVEVYSRINPFLLEDLPEPGNLAEARKKIEAFAEKAAVVTTPPKHGESPHPAVRITQNIRRRKTRRG